MAFTSLEKTLTNPFISRLTGRKNRLKLPEEKERNAVNNGTNVVLLLLSLFFQQKNNLRDLAITKIALNEKKREKEDKLGKRFVLHSAAKPSS